METLAILVAAGRGERMRAERPKAFLPLLGTPLLRRAALPFERAASVDAIVVVVPSGEEETARQMLRGIDKLHAVVPGGARRQDSVLVGLRAAPQGFDGVVLVHDAARPFVAPELVDAVSHAARQVGAALPVGAIVDTVKRVERDRVIGTLDRAALGAAQTPQGFRYALLVRAYAAASRDGVSLTDEAMAVERLGEPVAALSGPPTNRKLTTPDDMVWAEHLIRERGED